jgi:NAD(P)-dependent dehydrogenase (short-subunit alcohol dehydrogenase family)
MNMHNSRTESAIVVGATGAFGQHIVRALAARGLDVIAVARRAESLQSLEATCEGVRACQADIDSDDSIAAMAASIHLPVRMLVHGPGVTVAGGILEAPTATMTAAVNTKVGGLLRLVRAADAHLQKGSRIVAIGGHYGLEPTAYAASAGVANAALVNVVRQLSLALGPRGITAHTIVPGPADTDRLHKVAATRAAQRGVDVATVLEELKAESSLGELTTPEQVAWAVEMLLDPRANAMTGSALMLDSGRRRGLP